MVSRPECTAIVRRSGSVLSVMKGSTNLRRDTSIGLLLCKYHQLCVLREKVAIDERLWL